MQNTQNTMSEKKNDWASTAKSVADRAVSEVKNIDPQELKRQATEITSRVRDASADYYDDAVSYIRRNPVSAALGFCAFGFVAGMFTSWMKRAA